MLENIVRRLEMVDIVKRLPDEIVKDIEFFCND